MIPNIAKLPFIVASYPTNYDGLPFLSVVQLSATDKPVVGIIDNIDGKSIKIYTLEKCDAASVEYVMELANAWFRDESSNRPFSIEVARLQPNVDIAHMFRSIGFNRITRVMGPVFSFPMSELAKNRKRKRRPINIAVAA